MTHSPATPDGAVPGLDVGGLEVWLREAHPQLAAGPLSARLITGGKSNLTYRIDGARIPLVVRRPPLGHVLATAHDMAREHRVITALGASAVPVPPTVAIVDDTADGRVTGTPFFVMEFVDGAVLARPAQNAAFTRGGLHSIGIQLAEVLAELHSVDPASVGLDDFGRGDGYLERQLRTWRRQLDASRSRETPALDQLQDALSERMPENPRSGLVHGDYRLDNAIVAGSGDDPSIAAILDWEMSTLGDPLVDLGVFGMYWNIDELTGGRLFDSAVDLTAGYPGFDELVDAYAARIGRAVPDLGWYRGFAAYKLAVIAEGIHYRYQQHETVGDGFAHIGAMVAPLATDGLARLALRRN
ncbi:MULTISPECIES: phosphotransferase family protein [unclassified Leifsonia]|uniref:phosphotransferase family protein n=1 Tax=unclassified Leifsonia TaxID=2663824 RepID=UPI0006FA99CF|nr:MULTISPECIES: phosphotransferase family protein [unclassified Leifsonia]KQX08106.1 acyl-CoA dehydrogenase [Leifsonia sp. Root1293]KRA12387.1 acyl-CoA dehydrogenase [Leifsonia sp. Root60]